MNFEHRAVLAMLESKLGITLVLPGSNDLTYHDVRASAREAIVVGPEFTTARFDRGCEMDGVGRFQAMIRSDVGREIEGGRLDRGRLAASKIVLKRPHQRRIARA